MSFNKGFLESILSYVGPPKAFRVCWRQSRPNTPVNKFYRVYQSFDEAQIAVDTLYAYNEYLGFCKFEGIIQMQGDNSEWIDIFWRALD